MEEFALAQDRAKVLEQLIPGTEEHYFRKCLHFQHTGKLNEVETVLTAWMTRHGHTPRVEEIKNRQALLGYDKNPKASLERLKDQLCLSFHHERIVEGEKTNYPVELDGESVSYKAFKERAFQRSPHGNLSDFADLALEDLILDDGLDADRRRELLKRLKRPDHPKLVQRV